MSSSLRAFCFPDYFYLLVYYDHKTSFELDDKHVQRTENTSPANRR